MEAMSLQLMKQEWVVRRMDRTVFLAEFEFISGEYVQTFYHTVIESSNKKALREIKRFLREYYGRGNCTEYDKHREVYYYFGGDVAIRFQVA